MDRVPLRGLSSLDVLFQEAMVRGVTPGGQAWAMREGRTVYRRCFGHVAPGGSLVSFGTRYDLASLTKPLVTAVRVLQLLTGPGPSLDAPAHLGSAPSATFRHWLEHASGLPAHRVLGSGTEGSVRSRYRSVVAHAGREPPVAAPGRQAIYSDLGFILLGDWAELAGGLHLSRWLAHVGSPLTMADRRHRPEARIADAAPTRVGVAPGVVHDDNAQRMGGGGGHAGAFGTVDQVAVWVRRLLEDRDLLSAQAWEAMLRPSRVPGSSRTAGWDRPSACPRTTAPGWPRESIGHLGYTGCSLWLHLPSGSAAVLLTNRTWCGECPDPIRKLRQAYHQMLRDRWGLTR